MLSLLPHASREVFSLTTFTQGQTRSKGVSLVLSSNKEKSQEDCLRGPHIQEKMGQGLLLVLGDPDV